MRFVNLPVAAATVMTGAMFIAPGNAHAVHLGAPGLATQIQDQTLATSVDYRGGNNRGGSFSTGRSVSHFSSPGARSFVAPQRFGGSQNFVSQQRFVNTQRFVNPQPHVNAQRFAAPQNFVRSQPYVNAQRSVGQQRFVNPQPYIYPRRYVGRSYPYVIGGLGIAGGYYYGNRGYYGNQPYVTGGAGYDNDAVEYCVQTYGDAFDINTMTYLADDGRRYPCP
jgi:hypothetical protein